ncbi:MAG: hypothetical protein HQL88_10730 [Magnetococcales bacterium]|nr:hypothetical protein [Magnetococcales bacterium]
MRTTEPVGGSSSVPPARVTGGMVQSRGFGLFGDVLREAVALQQRSGHSRCRTSLLFALRRERAFLAGRPGLGGNRVV